MCACLYDFLSVVLFYVFMFYSCLCICLLVSLACHLAVFCACSFFLTYLSRILSLWTILVVFSHTGPCSIGPLPIALYSTLSILVGYVVLFIVIVLFSLVLVVSSRVFYILMFCLISCGIVCCLWCFTFAYVVSAYVTSSLVPVCLFSLYIRGVCRNSISLC